MTERIREDVANGVISRGELIKQTVLAKRYGVSATPVREALRILEADGVITYSPHKGASVREMTPGSARDLYRLRAATECAATQMAVERMTAEGLELVREKYQALSEALKESDPSPSKLSTLNRDFHFAIYRQSSPLVVKYLEVLWARFTPSATLFLKRDIAVELHKEHGQILEAIQNGDGALASELTAAHILRAADLREQDPNLRASGSDEGFDFT